MHPPPPKRIQSPPHTFTATGGLSLVDFELFDFDFDFDFDFFFIFFLSISEPRFQLWLFKPNPFSLDVKFNEDGTGIEASRLMIQAVNISDGNMEKDMVRELRRIAHESPLNVSVFHPYFVFFDQVRRGRQGRQNARGRGELHTEGFSNRIILAHNR